MAIAAVTAVAGTQALEFIKVIEYLRVLPKVTDGKHTKLVIVPQDMAALARMFGAMSEMVAQKDS